MAGLDDGLVDLGAGEDLIDGGGAEPGLQDGGGAGVVGESDVAQQPQHTVVFVLGSGDGRRRVQEPGGTLTSSATWVLSRSGKAGGSRPITCMTPAAETPIAFDAVAFEPVVASCPCICRFGY